LHPSKVRKTRVLLLSLFIDLRAINLELFKTGSGAAYEKLRERALSAGIKLGGGAAWHNFSSASGTHLDIEVTFKGLTALSAASRAAFQPTVMVFAGAGGSGGHNISWSPLPGSLDETDNGDGNADNSSDWVNGTAGGGPLALRLSQDTLAVRVLVDASVVEAFWDGGRARYTAHASAAGSPDVTNYEGGAGGGGAGVMVSAGAGLKEGLISADIDVYEMASMWLS
jgi:hypothetical protein